MKNHMITSTEFPESDAEDLYSGLKVTSDGIYGNHVVMRIECPVPIDAPNNIEDLLSRVIEQLDRSCEGVTMWLDAPQGRVVPHYILPALQKLSGFGPAVIVTYKGSASHAPGPTLDPDFCKAVKACNRSGKLWHPLAGCAVQAK